MRLSTAITTTTRGICIMNKNAEHSNYGYAENREALLKRLKRAEGQVRGISRMVEEDKYCIDILTQIGATQAALDKVALELVRDHAKHCLTNDDLLHGNTDEKADELVSAIGRLISR
jgi:CsoR family transcriptional regulator, copper-sensing transcriptional repressor